MNQNHCWNIFHVNVGVHKNGEKYTSKQEWKKGKCWCECKKPLKLHICKGNYISDARTGAYKCEYLKNYTRL